MTRRIPRRERLLGAHRLPLVPPLLLSSHAPVGYLAIAAMPVAINQGFIALKCNERASDFFMLNWCQTNTAEIESCATGTTFAEISKHNFRPIRIVLPPKQLMAAFIGGVAPLYAQITANLQQSRTLATLRDTLLPKLLSGEVLPSEMTHSLNSSHRKESRSLSDRSCFQKDASKTITTV